MAKLEGNIQITGSLDSLSFYKMRGSDKIIVRRKGGPSSKDVQQSPIFENTRRNNREFGGRAAATAFIKRVLNPLAFLADYNFTGPLNALIKPIQKLDTSSDWGSAASSFQKMSGFCKGSPLIAVIS